MKRKLIAPALITSLGVCVYADEAPTAARFYTTPTVSTSSESQSGRFGAGIIIGEPTGASLKYWLNDTMAVDGAFGWSFHDDSGFVYAQRCVVAQLRFDPGVARPHAGLLRRRRPGAIPRQQ